MSLQGTFFKARCRSGFPAGLKWVGWLAGGSSSDCVPPASLRTCPSCSPASAAALQRKRSRLSPAGVYEQQTVDALGRTRRPVDPPIHTWRWVSQAQQARPTPRLLSRRAGAAGEPRCPLELGPGLESPGSPRSPLLSGAAGLYFSLTLAPGLRWPGVQGLA